MSDEPSPSSYAPFIALAVVLALCVLALMGVLVAVLIALAIAPAVAPAAPALNAAFGEAAALNRLAVIAESKIYTIDPDGSDRLDLAHAGRVPTAAVIWSRDGQRLIFVASELQQSRLNSARPDGQAAHTLYETDLLTEPFYLNGAPDDQHVAFLAPDPLAGMQLRIAEPDRADSARSGVSGQPSYSSWSPDGKALLLHIGGTSRDAFVGTYALTAEQPQKIETEPAAFQAPGWSPTGEAQWLYARQSGANNQLVLGSANETRTLAEFDGGITFGWSPDGQRVAHALNTPDSFLYEQLTLIDLADSAARVIFKGDLLAFFWSPDGTKLAYLTGVLVEPSSIGRAGGRAAPARQQRTTLQVTWHVFDLETNRTIDLNTFEPTADFLYLIQYFDQFAQSVTLWSPDSRSLVYTGQPLIGEQGVYVIDAQDAAAPPRFVGPGDFAIWSWR
jgi:Tol biopolymer transport system component